MKNILKSLVFMLYFLHLFFTFALFFVFIVSLSVTYPLGVLWASTVEKLGDFSLFIDREFS
jgi:hypothetical protein